MGRLINAIAAASSTFRAGGRDADKEYLWESQLDELLAKGVQPTLCADEKVDHSDCFRTPGWYEMPGDPWNVHWWSGTAWVGQSVPLTVSMLAA